MNPLKAFTVSPQKFTRRAAIEMISAGFIGFVAQVTYGQASNALSANSFDKKYPYTQFDSGLLKIDENIQNFVLTEDEAKKLMARKIDVYVLTNPTVLKNLKDNYGVKTGKNIDPNKPSDNGIMKSFYENVIKEFKMPSPWNSSPENNVMTPKNVMQKLFTRMSAHPQVDDIQKELRDKYGQQHFITSWHDIKIDAVLLESYPFYLKILGPAETWRGNVPLDGMPLDPHSREGDKTIEDMARRRPQLDFVALFRRLGISQDICKVTVADFYAIGIQKNDPRFNSLSSRSAIQSVHP